MGDDECGRWYPLWGRDSWHWETGSIRPDIPCPGRIGHRERESILRNSRGWMCSVAIGGDLPFMRGMTGPGTRRDDTARHEFCGIQANFHCFFRNGSVFCCREPNECGIFKGPLIAEQKTLLLKAYSSARQNNHETLGDSGSRPTP
jgi:hypothetical protein